MLIALLFIIPKGAYSVNIALGRKAMLCDDTILPAGITDGITNISVNIANVKKLCTLGILVIYISFNDHYFVHYVTLHPGADVVDRRLLSYYKVSHFVNTTVFECSQIPEPYSALSFERGVRMNCRMLMFPVSNLFVTFLGFQNFSLGEIEIQTIASGEPNVNVLFYRGCFSYFHYITEVAFVDFDFCWRKCTNFSLMAIKGNKSCHCGFNYEFEDEITLDNCDLSCSISDRQCGGAYTYSLYIVNLQLPYYHGCSNEGPPLITIEMKDMSLTKCLYYCDQANFMWVKGSICGCTDKEPPKDVNPLRCNITCTGEPSDICGGKDRASVYGTCRHPLSELLPCDKLLQCSLNYNKYGECMDGCEEGFEGEHCIERVSSEGLHHKWTIYSLLLLTAIVLLILSQSLAVIRYYRLSRNKAKQGS